MGVGTGSKSCSFRLDGGGGVAGEGLRVLAVMATSVA